ncbi:16S rRNA (uracil(1498)-N(3))-methyltransferase [Leucobacter denitrificans]|uniref:Ribosomal RNA small subunit methyltransferase E n=1 Tax=Leucobacter denitrificans TaxID=683042 RepID=A0A7G9S5G7_9MICO|nr:16S rRNA (uracil(1498)-N(3))-methyltransferase [Leucobacter denitrificans]QNN63092.1 16S rRNA (uracil(1498)-N(3))-methyltransferase [Leucobacter denitrificans]
MANMYLDESLVGAAVGDEITVTGDEGRHAVRVSRLRVGEQTLIGNGHGLMVTGGVSQIDRDRFTVRVEAVRNTTKPTPGVYLVQALAKGDRDDRAIEQATEFGVDGVIPWQSDRSVSRWEGEKAAKGVAKWSRIAREASKQSMRGWIPEVRELTTLDELCLLAQHAHLLVLHPRGERRLSEWARELHLEQDIYLVVGPEGGLSDRELEKLAEAGAHTLLLGETVLRTSSAGPAALAVLNTQLGRW